MTDQELIERILDGDECSIHELHNRYADLIFHFLYLKTNRYHDAEELLQDVFYKAASQLNRFRGDSSFKTWIFKIAQNAVIDYYRKKDKSRYTISTEQDQLEIIGGKEESVENVVLRHLQVDEVLRHIDNLPHNYQMVLHLRFVEGFSIKETADIMGKSTLSIKSMQRRARAALVEQVKMEVSS